MNQENSENNKEEGESQKNITSLEGFFSELLELTKNVDQTKYEIFYRGHENTDYQLVPNLLRNNSTKNPNGQAVKDIVNNEHRAFRDIIEKQPSEFAQCNSAIEYLVKMQHFGLKTRLLDITSNALIALYFACTSSSNSTKDKNKTGQVIVFKLPKHIIKHYDSDTISAVANIAKCEASELQFPLCGFKDDREQFIKELYTQLAQGSGYKYIILQLLKEIEEAAKNKQNTKSIIQNLNNSISQTLKNKFPKLQNKLKRIEQISNKEQKGIAIEQLYRKIKDQHKNVTTYLRGQIRDIDTSKESRVSKEYKRWFNKSLESLHHQIKHEKSYYDPKIEPYDLGKIWAVNTKLDNPRIVNQKGAFLLFGLGVSEVEINGRIQLAYTKELYPEIPDEWIAGRINIESGSKKQILNELSTVGIHESFVFPELEKVAKEINQRLLSTQKNKKTSKSGEANQQETSSFQDEQTL
jgi:FRG domain protein